MNEDKFTQRIDEVFDSFADLVFYDKGLRIPKELLMQLKTHVLVEYGKAKAEQQQKLQSQDFHEVLAELEHEQWASWIRYMHSLRTSELNYVYAQQWKEWLRKSQTDYIQLREEEKESDRKFARKVIEKVVGLLLEAKP